MDEEKYKKAIFREIAKRAPLYAPEWRFSPERPDAGGALAKLWADMLAGTQERFERLPDNYKRALFDALGSEARPAVSALGFLSFTVSEDADDFIIPKGTVVSAPDRPDAELVTRYVLSASSVRITDIYRVTPLRDSIERYGGLREISLSESAQTTEHIWTFTHSFALNVSRAATLRLTPETDDSGLNILAASAWEYLDGGGWRGMPVIRDGASLRCVFPAAGEERCNAVRVSVTRDSVLHKITAKPSGSELFPDALYADSAQEQDGFSPFGQRFIPGVCAYFSNSDALTKPGAQVELSFTLNYRDYEIEGYAETQIHLKKLMRASDLELTREYTITAAEVKWEYYNGVGWAALKSDTDTALFSGEANGRIRVSFECPDDLKETVVGAHDLPFIRVRLISADNLFRRRGRYKSPYISDIRFSYWYREGVPITDISVTEYYDIFAKTLPAHLAEPPKSPAALYFASRAAFTRGTILFHLKPGGTGAGLCWEYMTDTGWQPLGVRDETGGLSKTGILSYETSLPAKNTRLWGQEAYWLRLVLDNTEIFDKHLYGLYENAVRAAARTPGIGSVLPAGAFTTIASPITEVESAVNPIAAYGGVEAETEPEVISRMSAALSHFGRAVSRSDVEELALEASRRVLCARYYPHTDTSGGYVYGRSCLVVFARDPDEHSFEDLRGELLAYINARRALCSGRIEIIPPRYIAVNVSAHIQIQNHGEALAVKNRIIDAFEALLAPMNWSIGQLPVRGQISAAIRAVHGVSRLIKTEVSYTLTSGMSADYTRAARESFVLPISGSHDFTFVSEEF